MGGEYEVLLMTENQKFQYFIEASSEKMALIRAGIKHGRAQVAGIAPARIPVVDWRVSKVGE